MNRITCTLLLSTLALQVSTSLLPGSAQTRRPRPRRRPLLRRHPLARPCPLRPQPRRRRPLQTQLQPLP